MVIPTHSGIQQGDRVRRFGDKTATEDIHYSQGIQRPFYQRPGAVSATLSPQRVLAMRVAKPMPSIEQSVQQPFDHYAFLETSLTPSTLRTRDYRSEYPVNYYSSRRRVKDVDDLSALPSTSPANMSLDEPSMSPYGCSMRDDHASKTSFQYTSLTDRLPSSSADHQASNKVPKQESTSLSPLAAQDRTVIIQTSPSPSVYDSGKRTQRLETDGFVQQPAIDFAEHRLAEARKEAALMEAIIDKGRRRQGEKREEHCSDRSRPQTFQNPGKRKLEEDLRAPYKRQKIFDPMRSDEFYTNNDSVDALEMASTSMSISTRSPDSRVGTENANKKRLEETEDYVKIKAEQVAEVKLVASESSIDTAIDDAEGSKSRLGVQSHIRDRVLPPCGKPRLTSCAEHGSHRKAQKTRRWYDPQRRREMMMPSQSHTCTCQHLPGYFTRQGLLMPILEHFPGGKLEFMTHVKQISKCHGHSDRLRNGCCTILEREKEAERCQNQNHAAKDKCIDSEDTMEWAQGFLSSDLFCRPSGFSPSIAANTSIPSGCSLQFPVADHSARHRQQSSIEPTRFYGRSRRKKHPLDIGRPPQSLTESSILPPWMMATPSTSTQLPTANHMSDHGPRTFSPLVAKVWKRKKEVTGARETTDDARQRSLSTRKRKQLKRSNGAGISSFGADTSLSPRLKSMEQIMPSAVQPLPDVAGDRSIPPSNARAESEQRLSVSLTSNEPFFQDDWRPVVDDDGDLLPPTPPHSSPANLDQDISQSRDHLIPDALSMDDNQSNASRRSRALPPALTTNTIRDENFTSQRQRHQSLPAQLRSSSNMTTALNMPTPHQTPQRQPLQPLSPNLDLVMYIKDMAANLKQMQQTIAQNLLPSTTPTTPTPAPHPPQSTPNPPHPPRPNRPNLETLKRLQPQLSPDIQHLPDASLIEIGKRINGYQRHVGAPYAFSRRGRLRAAFDGLLGFVGEDGRRGWSAKEMARVKS